jgi:hypothetical protein
MCDFNVCNYSFTVCRQQHEQSLSLSHQQELGKRTYYVCLTCVKIGVNDPADLRSVSSTVLHRVIYQLRSLSVQLQYSFTSTLSRLRRIGFQSDLLIIHC